jgi:malonyl-CoA O-methyltransferase
MASSHQPPSIDPHAAQRLLALPAHDARTRSPWLHEEVAERMIERLEFITLKPQRWIDWHAEVGGERGHARLRAFYPDSEVFRQIAGVPPHFVAIKNEANKPDLWLRLKQRFKRAEPAVQLAKQRTKPFEPASAQMVWANMLLHRAADPFALIREWHAALDVGGFLMFSALGPDSLIELRQWYAQEGWAPPAHEFTDLHDWGDMLVQSGFAEPVMSMERITLTYSNAPALLADLRAIGRNLSTRRDARTHGRAWQATWLEKLEARRSAAPDGLLKLSFEVIYGHAVKAAPKLKVAEQSAVSLQDMRAMLRKKPQ